MHYKLYKVCNMMTGKTKEGSIILINFSSRGSVVIMKWTKYNIV
jgi:hypothetical protein